MSLLLLFWLLPFPGPGQNDTNLVADTTLHFKEVPISLKKLIEGVTTQKDTAIKEVDIEIDGLLFDETKTKNGREFYTCFYTAWEAPPGAKNYAIFISEKPYRLTTTLIEIRINEILVFQNFLQPKTEAIEQLTSQAVTQTQMYLANYEEVMRQLEGKDQSGSGIY